MFGLGRVDRGLAARWAEVTSLAPACAQKGFAVAIIRA